MSEFAIETRDLIRTFHPRRQPPVRAVDGLTFAVRRGSIFGLLGPNGAGKTTTLRMLTTLLPPSSGVLNVEGFDPVRQPLEVRRRIAVVIQESAAEIFLSVADNLSTFGRFHGLSANAVRAKAAEVIDQFGLASDVNRKVMDLSGGFRRRVQVAKAFMVDTPILFLDEFSTGMDPLLKRSIMSRLREEAARGRTIVLTTQILNEAEDLCDDILIINNGREAARGDVNALKMMSAGLYDVTVTFDRAPERLDSIISEYQPRRVEVNQNTVIVSLKGQESRALNLVADLGRLGHVLRLEVSGASLEDIFIELTSGRGTI